MKRPRDPLQQREKRVRHDEPGEDSVRDGTRGNDSRTAGKTGTPRVDLQGVATWEPRGVVDRLWMYTSSAGIRVAVVLLALALFNHEFDLVSTTLFGNPSFLVLAGGSALPAALVVAYVWYVDPTKRERMSDAPARDRQSDSQGRAGVSPLSVAAIRKRTSRARLTALVRNPPLGVVLVALFVLGGLFTAFAASLTPLLELYVQQALLGTETPEVLVSLLIVFVVVAPVEELAKLLGVWLYAVPQSVFASVFSGALFGAVVGLGFATVENALFIADAADGTVTLALEQNETTRAIERAAIAPGHVIYTAIAGYYLGLAQFNREYATPLVFRGVVIAVVLHGIYNVLVAVEIPSPWWLADDVPGHLASLTGFSHTAAVVTVAILYHGILFAWLVYRLSFYRAAYHQRTHQRNPESELTEFDP